MEREVLLRRKEDAGDAPDVLERTAKEAGL